MSANNSTLNVPFSSSSFFFFYHQLHVNKLAKSALFKERKANGTAVHGSINPQMELMGYLLQPMSGFHHCSITTLPQTGMDGCCQTCGSDENDGDGGGREGGERQRLRQCE